jgi:hypothetical protein
MEKPHRNSLGNQVNCIDGSMELFASWFGDSKAVDRHGRPLVVFHGTASDFSTFNTGRGAIYFTSDPAIASMYAGQASCDAGEEAPNVLSVYLSMQNPLIVDEAWAIENLDDEDGRDWTILDNILYDAEERGYDGMIMRGVVDYAGRDDEGKRHERAYDQYIVFRSEQIKSATGNPGSYNSNERCIADGVSLSLVRSKSAGRRLAP